jgi:hypothetical protein
MNFVCCAVDYDDDDDYTYLSTIQTIKIAYFIPEVPSYLLLGRPWI